jgi:dTDP-4-amino-4,6-dideoxygalactose transaminase
MSQPAAIKIPLMDLRPQTAALKAQLLEGFSSILDLNAYCLGPEVETFERDFAAYCGAAHGVGVNSGTSALHLALLALGVGPGDEVVTTPFTFVATAWAISYTGAKPVFADIQPDTFLLDPKAVEKAITPRTKAIIPVHLYGQPADMDAFQDLARRKGLPILEDSAQAHGATYKGRRTGSLGTLAAFSFYPSKNLGACGEGGMVVTQDAGLAAKIRALRDHGSTKRYYHDTVGFNYRMEGLQGFVLRTKLPHLDGWNARRQALAKLYNEMLAGCAVTLPRLAPDRTHVYHLYSIRHPRRDALAEYLKAQGIGSAMHYPVPVHLQRAYGQLGYKPGSMPHAEKAAQECLSLPVYPELADEQAKSVALAVRQWLKEEGKGA